MNRKPTRGSDEAQEILESLRKIQDSDELRAEAETGGRGKSLGPLAGKGVAAA